MFQDYAAINFYTNKLVKQRLLYQSNTVATLHRVKKNIVSQLCRNLGGNTSSTRHKSDCCNTELGKFND